MVSAASADSRLARIHPDFTEIKVRVEHYLRQGTQWISTEFRKLTNVLPLISIDCALPLRDIYRRATF